MRALGRTVACTAILLGALQAAHSLGQAETPKVTTPNQVAPAKNAFEQCAVCHSTDGSNGTGPTLKGVYGRQSGTLAGFRYSRAMRAAAITWDDKSLDQYLSNPQEFIAGNVMPFAGVPVAAERAELIAYLRTLK